MLKKKLIFVELKKKKKKKENTNAKTSLLAVLI